MSTYPSVTDFESDLGIWVNATGDDLEWTRNAGGTPGVPEDARATLNKLPG